MPKLDQYEPYNWARAFREAYDETIRMPLWEFPPEARKPLLSERLRRGFTYGDDQTPDPEYH